MQPVARAAKQMLGGVVASVSPQCRYRDCIFIIGHMRCGSTALSNVLCSRPEVSGYGEAHVAYGDRSALGILALNQLRRGAWRAGASRLFDKILHSRYDADADPAFFDSRAIFVVRAPQPSILSIRTMFAAIGSDEYPDDAVAAAYYRERMTTLMALWHRFPTDRRIGITHERLTTNPDRELARLSHFLGFAPPLENRYSSKKASQRRGAGDPLVSHRLDSIVATTGSPPVEGSKRKLELSSAEMDGLQKLYDQFVYFTKA